MPTASHATPTTSPPLTNDVMLRAAVSELAGIMYGDGPTDTELDSFGPVYATAVEQLRAAFDDAAQDLLRGFCGVLPQDAARKAWEGLRHMTGLATNFRPLDLLLAQAAHTYPEPLPTSFDELLGAIARQNDARSLKALLLRVLDAPPSLSRADRLRLQEVLTSSCGLDAEWVKEWRASLPLPSSNTASNDPQSKPQPYKLALAHQEEAPETNRWSLCAEEGVDMLKPPVWLINGIIPAGQVTVVAGAGDAGKTFIMVDMINRVAQHYPTLYVAAEDASGLRIRKRAWEMFHNAERKGNFYALPDVLPLGDTALVDSFVAAIKPHHFRMIVVDTLSQCIAGVDENSSNAMSIVMSNAQHIARVTGAAVILVHHYTKDGSTYRGSSVLKNNAYGFLEVERDSDDLIRLECNRIKNATPFAPRYFRLNIVATDVLDDYDEPITSCVIVPANKIQRSAGDLSKVEIRILETLQVMTDADNGAVTTILQQELGLKGRSFYGPLAHLRKYGYIAKDGDKRTAPLIITEAGREQLARHSAHPDLQSTTPVSDAPSFEVNQRLKLLPLVHGSNPESNFGSGSNLISTHVHTIDPSTLDTTDIPVTSNDRPHQKGQIDIPSSYFPVTTTPIGSNGHTPPVTTFHSRSLSSGMEGSNGGVTSEEQKKENTTPEKPAEKEVPQKPVWLKLPESAWQQACKAWMDGNTTVVNTIAQQHRLSYSDLVRALKRTGRSK